ncbi:hypothetical protein SAMN05444007_101474 [Cribrihabitans marinus]|uniref:Uncharacterized protein n=1 Tax=Cribrihabitans marinus TaxID=1227549 RepID=A0A1H6RBQ3_9RHOB|nr:hypothetical protein [Cribrihabitans marinus]GGH20891.1 hypothetical protein GCM10010973_05160 [Cribrihabitans marinus]SEI53278.1 hypothetical protein SAMN05444007_101474 [Cribrihabitans marinus]
MRLAVLALCAGIALLATVFYRSNPVTEAARAYAGDVATASAGIYVSLRTLNAVLSSAQEVEVGGSLVASASAQPFRFLEPIDDTIERIAGVVFNVMIVTGVLSVAMGPVSAVGAGMMALALGIWMADRGIGRHAVVVALSRRLVWYGLFLALALPVAFLLSGLVADRLTEDVWAEHAAVIAEISADAESAIPDTDAPAGWWQNLGSAMDEAGRYQEIVANVSDRADDLLRSYIAILAVFIFKILVLPALLIGAFFVLARFLSRSEGAA